METICEFNSKIFEFFKELWYSWTQVAILISFWNQMWISNKINYWNQIFLSMVLFKRKIWYNYTTSLHEEDKFNSEETIIYQWIGCLQWTIKFILIHIQHNPKISTANKETHFKVWSLNSNWAICDQNNWKSNITIPNKLIAKHFLKQKLLLL